MDTEQEIEVVELGVASEETLGTPGNGVESLGHIKAMGISDDD
jgi:hypothetical protein